MATHIQRKQFEHPQLAAAAAEGFGYPYPIEGPLVTVTSEAREIDGTFWVYVTSEGTLVDANALLLSDYELVALLP